MLNRESPTRREIAKLHRKIKRSRWWILAALIIFIFVFAVGFKLPEMSLLEFGLPATFLSSVICMLPLRHTMSLMLRVRELENSLRRPLINNPIDEQVVERETFSKRLEKISMTEPVRLAYKDPFTHNIMNFPVFLNCGHNIDDQTHTDLKEKDAKNCLCPHPHCKQPIDTKLTMRNIQLENKIEAYVSLQEAKARSQSFIALPELKARLGLAHTAPQLMKTGDNKASFNVPIDIKSESDLQDFSIFNNQMKTTDHRPVTSPDSTKKQHKMQG